VNKGGANPVSSFRAVGGAADMVEECIERLRSRSKTVETGSQPEHDYLRGRRAAVIVLYATGVVGVTEGWNLDGNDFKNALLLENQSTNEGKDER